MRVKCFAQEHKTMTPPGLEPGPLDPESSVLTIKSRLSIAMCAELVMDRYERAMCFLDIHVSLIL